MRDHSICSVEEAGMLIGRVRHWMHNPKQILKNYIKPGIKALDFGCGPGFFTVPMAQMGAKVIAADLQQGMLDIVEEKIDEEEIENRIKLAKCSETDINVKEKVDFILLFYVLHEIKHKEEFFEQIKKTFKKGTKMLISEPMFHVPRGEFKEELEMAEKHGFRVVDRPKILLSRSVVLMRK